MWEDEVFQERIKKERIAINELQSATRKSGHATLRNIAAIILETTGDLPVISKIEVAKPDALEGVKGFPAEGTKTVLRFKQEGR